jgi:hypothetical protein
VKILSARILASTKNVQILFARILTRKKSENPFCLNFARTKNSRILFARILARKKSENPICENSRMYEKWSNPIFKNSSKKEK